MAICEMCGKESSLFRVLVEGSTLNVCEKCSRHGKVLGTAEINLERKHISKVIMEPQIAYEIVSDYAERIKKAREQLKMKQEDLALKISEKVVEIHKLESNKIKPSFRLARKLEKFLNIGLIEQIFEDKTSKLNFKDGNLTIGDILNLKKNKNE